jgi:hypothetical protein
MQPRTGIKLAGGAALFAVSALGGYRLWRGPLGATEARLLADFPSADVGRWVNGAPAPLASLRGKVVPSRRGRLPEAPAERPCQPCSRWPGAGSWSRS